MVSKGNYPREALFQISELLQFTQMVTTMIFQKIQQSWLIITYNPDCFSNHDSSDFWLVSVIVVETIGVTRFKKNFGFNNEAPLMDDFPSISEVPGMGQVKIVHPEVPLPRFVGFKTWKMMKTGALLVRGFKLFFHNIWDVILPNWLSYLSRWLKPPTRLVDDSWL